MFGWLMDPMYLAFLLPAMILAGLATLYTKSTFKRYSRKAASSGMTGAQAASQLLNSQGIYDVNIQPVQGFLSDHYDPSSRTLRLSPNVYGSQSLSAIGVACHEAGHALQHAGGYLPLTLRSALVPATQFGSSASYFLFIIGWLFRTQRLMQIGAMVFGAVVLFSIVTLPVEWNATARARKLMTQAGIVTQDEAKVAGRVLNAAFLTYVASAFTALMTFLYYLLRSGLLGGGDD
ncbi:MAG: zinc metallopeptidase [Kiritimatiellia bacterium]|nr:zinc metallopeptidase [Kiritimatiellia bacterium]MDP6848241.1 zinc metallopeptidase [Kiritimatiellia bacterium]